MGFPVNVVSEAGRIGQDIAGPSADAVDREARFPSETIEALGASGLLGALFLPNGAGPESPSPRRRKLFRPLHGAVRRAG